MDEATEMIALVDWDAPGCVDWLMAEPPKDGTHLYADNGAELIKERDRAYELLFKDYGRLRRLVELIFASTLPYNDGNPTFIDKVTEEWTAICSGAQPKEGSRDGL